MVTPAGPTRAEDPLGQMLFLPKLAEAVPAASIHRLAERDPPHDKRVLFYKLFHLHFPGLFTYNGKTCFLIDRHCGFIFHGNSEDN